VEKKKMLGIDDKFAGFFLLIQINFLATSNVPLPDAFSYALLIHNHFSHLNNG
jgi:hypothetical protein